MSKIPSVQTAAVVEAVGGSLEIRNNHPVAKQSDLKPGECLVRISHSGVCHTDLHAAKGDWPVPPCTPLIGGHEGVGEIVAIGDNTAASPVNVGDRVGIKWLADSCLNCEFCKRGYEMNCGEAKLSGYTTDGTFSQYVRSFVNHVTPIPASLDSAGAASLLCAGVTTYKALKNANVYVGNYVAIPGAGGGLGHLAVQYAVAMGLRVIAIDSGSAKRDLCMKLGATAFVDFSTTKDLVKEIQDAAQGLGPHAAVIVATHESAFKQAVDYLRPGGTMVCVGLPNAALAANTFWTVFKSIRIQGSYVGNRQDASEALQLAADGKVTVHYQLKGLDKLKEVYDDMEAGKIAGRIVLEV